LARIDEVLPSPLCANLANNATRSGTAPVLCRCCFGGENNGQMGPSVWHENSNPFLRVTLLGVGLICGLFVGSSPLLAQADRAISAATASELQESAADATTPASGQPQ